ncbi:hypothetical protein CYLTODRAFT_201631 [Cylindrobasidium torrendii FP15055 ss-10]|uniref:Secreted protein n=1 Tax=Cylindrobasidium torrendii FP15055 ss-10 TaxID=1314674 RepID=A0A0D7AVI2_9AGAR|nr:hypothetical protein CYLTODRAFT_201631 [Cylindrobasidium torrendii FP15055 ss-10]
MRKRGAARLLARSRCVVFAPFCVSLADVGDRIPDFTFSRSPHALLVQTTSYAPHFPFHILFSHCFDIYCK